MNCYQCGAVLPQASNFCRACGTKVEDSQTAKDATRQHEPVAQIISAKSDTARNLAIAAIVVFVVAGASYWAWMRKVDSDANAAQFAAVMKQMSQGDEELRRKESEGQIRREAEERISRELEDRIRREEAQKLALANVNQAPPPVQPTAQPAVPDVVLERAKRCADIDGCANLMLEAIYPIKAEALQVAAARLNELNKAQRGERKVARALNQKGLDELKASNFLPAIELLKQASLADPADVEIASNLGYAYLKADRADDAARSLFSALAIDPRRTSAWAPISECFALKGRNEEAVRALLLGYEFSSNKEKTIAFYEEKKLGADREAMKPIYATASQRISQNR